MFLILACIHYDYYDCDYGLGMTIMVMTIITTKDKNDDNDDDNKL